MKRPKQSATAKSVDQLPVRTHPWSLPAFKREETRAQWGVAIPVIVVVLAYVIAFMLVKSCVHR